MNEIPDQEGISFDDEALPQEQPVQDFEGEDTQTPVPAEKRPARYSWLGCLIGILVIVVVFSLVGLAAWRAFRPSMKRLEVAAQPGPKATIQLPEDMNLHPDLPPAAMLFNYQKRFLNAILYRRWRV